jgi:uncharacterized membrane protein YfcA
MEIFLPIAGRSINILLVVSIGGLVGFLSGLFGVGGGFLLTPLMMMIGIPPAVAAASDSNQMVAAASSGAAAHSRMGHVDFKMGFVLIVGGVVGGTVGVQVVHLLRALGDFAFAVRVVYVVMLSIVGGLMFVESLTALLRSTGTRRSEAAAPSGSGPHRGLAGWFQRWPLQMHFERSGLQTSAIFPFLAGVFVGFLAALLGVGGGFIMVPMMIYIIGMPTVIAIGTSLLQIALVVAVVTVEQAITNRTVDIPLAVTLFCGSVIGVQIGARVSRLLRGEQIRIFLAALVLAVAVKLLLDLTMTPDQVIGYARATGGH